MAAEMLGSALVQEAVSRVSSFVFSKREERAPLEHIVERLEMALSELEFTLERSAKLPITDVALLRRRKLFKRAYEEASDVLNKHKPPSVKASEDQAQSKGAVNLSCYYVGRLEWLADHAGKFAKPSSTKRETGRFTRRFFIWPMCFEDRGVEAVLSYLFEDRETPPGGGRGFQLVLALRLSESTDIAGTAVKCLRSLASQFRITVAEFATGEIALLHTSDLQGEISDSYAPPWMGIHEDYTQDTRFCRPDPTCCCEPDNGRGQPCFRTKFPEGVIFTSFRCCIPAEEYSPLFIGSSADEGMGARDRILELAAAVAPHGQWDDDGLQEGYALEIIGGREERRNGSMQEIAGVAKVRNGKCDWKSQGKQHQQAAGWKEEAAVEV
ncbi:hypothetical protein QOZ80_7AG0557500 [Eleusine coracana subsp. coracana]|nr:hypothetical protein QOZ80_7AG0557500 [Eleusine coracana subsp. coracana]